MSGRFVQNAGSRMTEFDASYERIAETPKGSIVGVVFRGTYPPGSAGNEFANEMVRFLRSVLAETNPVAVLLDLTGVDYIWGDSIAGLALPLFEGGKGIAALPRPGAAIPGAIVAIGRTASALKPLLEPLVLLGLASVRLFGSRQEAVAHLEQAVSASTT